MLNKEQKQFTQPLRIANMSHEEIIELYEKDKARRMKEEYDQVVEDRHKLDWETMKNISSPYLLIEEEWIGLEEFLKMDEEGD